MALEQRRGETDEEFEARKKRVRRQRQVPLNDKYAHARRAGGGSLAIAETNACVTKGTDGTWQGAEILTPPEIWAYGSITPTHAISGQLTYALKWKLDGTFVIRIGDAGNEKIPDTDLAVLRYNGKYTMGMIWSSTERWYEGSDLALTTELDAIALDEQICFDISIVPNLFIHYDFTLERGTL